VAAIIALLLVLGIAGVAGVAGFVVYQRYVQQVALERDLVEAEAQRMRAEVAALEAKRLAERAEAELNNAAEAELAELARLQGEIESAPPQPRPESLPEDLFEAEIAPLNQAVEDRPEDPKVWQDRARVLQRWRKWQAAAEDYERFLEKNPNNVWMRLEAAATRFANGDRDAYLAHCKIAEERLAMKTQPTNEHNRAARVLSLAPGALTQGDFLLIMAQDEPLKNPGKWWLLEPMLALQYRTGRYEDALKTIDEVRPLAGFSGQRAATEIWAAMTCHQLGRQDEARQALAAAERYIAGGLPPAGAPNAGGDAVIISLYLIDEAKELIAGPAKSANNMEK
jgi:tetratricopeptide (TPR) repeat protein